MDDINQQENVDLKPNDDTANLCGLPQQSGEATKLPKALNIRQLNYCKHRAEGYSMADSVRMAKFNAKDPSHTGNYLEKRQDILYEIDRQRSEIRQKAMVDKPTFVLLVKKHLEEAKQEGTKARLLQLYGDLLGFTAKDTPVQVNLLQHLDKAEAFFKVKE